MCYLLIALWKVSLRTCVWFNIAAKNVSFHAKFCFLVTRNFYSLCAAYLITLLLLPVTVLYNPLGQRFATVWC